MDKKSVEKKWGAHTRPHTQHNTHIIHAARTPPPPLLPPPPPAARAAAMASASWVREAERGSSSKMADSESDRRGVPPSLRGGADGEDDALEPLVLSPTEEREEEEEPGAAAGRARSGVGGAAAAKKAAAAAA